MSPSPGDQPWPAFDVELGEHVIQMGLDGGLADEEPAGHLLVGQPVGDEADHVDLPWGQRFRPLLGRT